MFNLSIFLGSLQFDTASFNNRGFPEAASKLELSSTPEPADVAVGMADIQNLFHNQFISLCFIC